MDIPFYRETEEDWKLSVLTPVKAIKGTTPEITQREKAAMDILSTIIYKVRQLIKILFN